MRQIPEREEGGYFISYIHNIPYEPNDGYDCSSNSKWHMTETDGRIRNVLTKLDPIIWAIKSGYTLINYWVIENEDRYQALVNLRHSH